MNTFLEQFFEQMLVGPVWPATILLALMIAYAIVAMFGLVELDAGLDLDIDLDVDPGIDLDGMSMDTGGADMDVVEVSGAGLLSSLGAITIRSTNFGRVPIAIWGGVFTLAFWAFAFSLWHGYDSSRYSPALIPSILLSIRNIVFAVAVTKLVTQPLVGKFTPIPGYDKSRIIGSTCEISSIEATPKSGQAKFRTNAAPLLLNVRTDGPHIERGTEVRIIGFEPTKRIYKVSKILTENES